ncbi:MAG: cytochrome c oxidase assembly protein, partial [Chthoniobacteraceae bacterium]
YLIAALGMVILALVSPINALADGYLFSAHMLQHMLLLLIVPALLVLSLPRSYVAPGFLRKGGHPVAGWMAGVGAMWFWHAPAMCNAATTSRPVFAVQTVSLLVLGGLFWWQVIAPRDQDRLSPPGAIVYLFTACVACTVLGIILTFSPVTVCSAYMHPADPQGLLNTLRTGWRMTPEKDQQIGGLLMWVPMCMIYLTAIFAQLVRWFSPAGTDHVHAATEKIQ